MSEVKKLTCSPKCDSTGKFLTVRTIGTLMYQRCDNLVQFNARGIEKYVCIDHEPITGTIALAQCKALKFDADTGGAEFIDVSLWQCPSLESHFFYITEEAAIKASMQLFRAQLKAAYAAVKGSGVKQVTVQSGEVL